MNYHVVIIIGINFNDWKCWVNVFSNISLICFQYIPLLNKKSYQTAVKEHFYLDKLMVRLRRLLNFWHPSINILNPKKAKWVHLIVSEIPFKKSPYEDKSTVKTSNAVNCSISFLKDNKERSKRFVQLKFLSSQRKNHQLLGEVQVEFSESFIGILRKLLLRPIKKDLFKCFFVDLIISQWPWDDTNMKNQFRACWQIRIRMLYPFRYIATVS